MKVRIENDHIVFTADCLVDASELTMLGHYTGRHVGITSKDGTPFEISVTVDRINQTFLDMEREIEGAK